MGYFYCALCSEEVVLTTKLCKDCDRIHKLYILYGKDALNNAINKCFLVGEKGRETKITCVEKMVKAIKD